MNRLIVIGCVGIKKCYLNTTMDEAIKRYCDDEDITIEEYEKYDIPSCEFEFDDEFDAYDVWEK